MQENTLWQHDICQKSEFHKYTVHTVHSWFPSRHKRTYSVAAMGAIHFPQLPLHNFIQGEGIEYFIWCIPVFYPLFSVNYRHLYSIYFQINKYCFYLVVCFLIRMKPHEVAVFVFYIYRRASTLLHQSHTELFIKGWLRATHFKSDFICISHNSVLS